MVHDYNLQLLEDLGQDKWNELYLTSSTLGITHERLNPTLFSEVEQSLNKFVNQIDEYQPDLIAITVFSYMQCQWTELIIEYIRKRYSGDIVIGGPGAGATTITEHTLGYKLVKQGILNYYILGEGDHTFLAFLKGQTSLPGINSNLNISFSETWPTQIDDLDSTLIPTYSNIDVFRYVPFSADKYSVSITGSRGCVRRCTFCDVGFVWKKFRFRSAAHILKEMKHHHEVTGLVDFFFTDSLINGSMKQFMELLKGIIELKKEMPSFEKIKFSGQFIVRPKDQHPELMYNLMQQAGCDHLQIGIESGSESVREHMGKKFSNADIDYHMEMSSKYKIRNFPLFFVAYPTETREDFLDTVRMLERYQKYLIDNTIIGVNLSSPVMILKHSPLDHMRDALGIIPVDPHASEEVSGHNWRVESNPDLTINEKFVRYAEAMEAIINLRYPNSSEIIVFLQTHKKDFIKLQPT